MGSLTERTYLTTFGTKKQRCYDVVFQNGCKCFCLTVWPWMASIHEIRQQYPTCTTFEEVLKLAYSIEDTPRQHGGDWRIGRKHWKREWKCSKSLGLWMTFGRLWAWYQTILMPDKLAMFPRVVDVWDRHDLGMLLEDVTVTAKAHRP